jgi:hypothetical protein
VREGRCGVWERDGDEALDEEPWRLFEGGGTKVEDARDEGSEGFEEWLWERVGSGY